MIKILLADDHAIMRSGLKGILARVPEFELLAEASNGSEVLDILCQKNQSHEMPDLLLTDLSMPGISGPELIERVKSLFPKLPVLVLTMFNEAQMVTRIIKAGADGYVTKDSPPEELIEAVRKVASGGKYIERKLAEQMLFNNASTETLHSKLSSRELEVLRLLLQGRSVNHIAEQLFISNKTVSTHKAHLLEKMGMNSMTELVRYSVQHDLFPGLIPLPNGSNHDSL